MKYIDCFGCSDRLHGVNSSIVGTDLDHMLIRFCNLTDKICVLVWGLGGFWVHALWIGCVCVHLIYVCWENDASWWIWTNRVNNGKLNELDCELVFETKMVLLSPGNMLRKLCKCIAIRFLLFFNSFLVIFHDPNDTYNCPSNAILIISHG